MVTYNVSLENKVVLVTGAAGFIGANLVKRLLNEFDSVKVIGIDSITEYYDVRLKYERLQELSAYGDRFIFIKDNIAKKEIVESIFTNYHPQVVVNLAAQAGVRYSITNPDAYIESNLIGFYNILESCRHHGVEHLVYASSSSVYGSNKKVPYSTDDKVDNPVSLYAATKKSNELMAHAYSKLYNIPSTGLRFFTVYGPCGRPDMAYFSFTNKLLKGETIQIYNYGNCKRDFTYIDDIVEGMVRIMQHAPEKKNGDDGLPIPPYKVYNIGNNSPENLLDFVTILQDELIHAGVLPNDTAVDMNKTYKWRFTPADTNYEILTGEIELYHVDAPAVTAQPKSVSVTVGDTATFEVTATGTDVTYQWQIDRNDGKGFVDITGATGATYTIGVTDRDCNGFKYRCVLSNAAGSVTTDTVVLTVQYQIIEGANGSWNQNTDGRSLKIRGNGEYSKFQNVKVDGNIIDSKNYTVSEGSTIIELHADYLKTLSEGSHTFEIVWTDGAAGTSFTVARNTSGSNNTGSNNTGNNDNNDSTDNSAAAASTAAATAQELDKVPATGDPLGIWLMLFAISLTGLAGMLARRKKN